MIKLDPFWEDKLYIDFATIIMLYSYNKYVYIYYCIRICTHHYICTGYYPVETSELNIIQISLHKDPFCPVARVDVKHVLKNARYCPKHLRHADVYHSAVLNVLDEASKA